MSVVEGNVPCGPKWSPRARVYKKQALVRTKREEGKREKQEGLSSLKDSEGWNSLVCLWKMFRLASPASIPGKYQANSSESVSDRHPSLSIEASGGRQWSLNNKGYWKLLSRLTKSLVLAQRKRKGSTTRFRPGRFSACSSTACHFPTTYSYPNLHKKKFQNYGPCLCIAPNCFPL